VGITRRKVRPQAGGRKRAHDKEVINREQRPEGRDDKCPHNKEGMRKLLCYLCII